jgi:hypothetical protein
MEKKPQEEKGQIAIMVGVMMMTFMLFFAFVINTGMLVNAKINLQNAADLAAYAGAAVQARQLNQISYLNYEMRRQWKKFLFRIYVLGNMAQDEFPRTAGESGPMQYRPNQNSTADLKDPTTCVIFNANDNYCHIDTLPAISIPSQAAGALDSVTGTLIGQLQALEQIRQLNCLSIGQTNLILNLFWMFNADPHLTQFQNSSLQQSQQNAVKIVQGLAQGLGIVPREMILRYRIGSLEKYVNAPGQQGVTKEILEGLLKKGDPATYERTAQAFYSAYYTLGNHTFPADSIFLDELIPGGASLGNLIRLNDIKKQFQTYAIDMSIGGGNAVGSGIRSDPSPCNPTKIKVGIAAPLTLGVYKEPTILTYYAIRLKAKANLLFSPFGAMDLKAYSAAMPFGSRIGPSIEQGVDFGYRDDSAGATSIIPNLPILQADSPARSGGWNERGLLGTMYSFMTDPGSNGATGAITADTMERAYQGAMAPNPWEVGWYNIINDEGSDPFVRNFGIDENAAFWAPIFAPGQFANMSQALKDKVNELFDESTQGNLGATNGATTAATSIKQALYEGLSNYISNQLPSGQGENGEGVNLVRITNPFKRLLPDNRTWAPIQTGSKFFASGDQVKTSWNQVNDSEYRKQGRVGYSVKFVAFEYLKKRFTTNGGVTFSNSLPSDVDLDQDIEFIKH